MTVKAPVREPEVGLTFPAGADMWALARMCVSTLASHLDFTIEALDDLRLAVNELCRSCADGASASSSVSLRCTWSPGTLWVYCRTDGLCVDPFRETAYDEFTTSDLSDKILAALTRDHRLELEDEETRTGWFSMDREYRPR